MTSRVETRIERVWLSNLKGAPHRRTVGAHGFQAWLDAWWALEDDGYDVTILVAQDNYYSHAVALACRSHGAQLRIPGVVR